MIPRLKLHQPSLLRIHNLHASDTSPRALPAFASDHTAKKQLVQNAGLGSHASMRGIRVEEIPHLTHVSALRRQHNFHKIFQ